MKTKINLKKGRAIKKLLAFAMALALALVALAPTAEPVKADPTYSIKITGVASGSHTFSAYQIFSGSLSGTTSSDYKLASIEWGSGVPSANQSSLLSALANINVSISSSTVYPFNSTKAVGGDAFTTAQQVADALAEYNTNTEVVEAFETLLATGSAGSYTYLSATATAQATSGTANSGTYDYTIDVSTPGAGYYLVIDETSSMSQGDAYSAYILQVLGTVELAIKEGAPTVTKEIQEDSDSTWGTYGDYDENQAISYRLIGTLPQGTESDSSVLDDYTTYAYKFTDTMSSGLTLSDSTGTTTATTGGVSASDASTYSIAISIYGKATYDESPSSGEYTISDAGIYTLTGTAKSTISISDTNTKNSNNIQISWASASVDSSGDPYYGGTVLTIDIANILALYTGSSDDGLITLADTDIIVVTYYAILNSNAVVGNGGNPNKVSLEYSDNPNDSSKRGTTVETTVYAFTFEIDATKVSSTNTATTLEGAKFKLYYTVSGTPDKTYYAILSGSNNTYKVTGWTETEASATAIESSSSGTFSITGLDAGTTYYLEETEAPTGYNLLTEPVSIAITANYNGSTTPTVSSLSTTWTNANVTGDNPSGSVSTGIVSGKIGNTPASSLPTTGGIGTTMLYVLGGCLVLIALVCLIALALSRRSKRRA